MTLGELVGPEAKLSAAVAALPISGIAVDSRQVKPGNLFAALPGVNADGARFAADMVMEEAEALAAAPASGQAAVERAKAVDELRGGNVTLGTQ